MTTTYTLQCTGPGGSVTQGVTVTVTLPVLYTLTVSPTTVAPGASVTVSWTAPAADVLTNDWVGIYKVGDPSDKAHLLYAWKYTSGASGNLSLSAPTTSGSYEVRYFKNNGYEVRGVPAPLTVQ